MKTFKIALIATLVSTSSLLAQPNGPMPFSSFDTNNDGIITRYEFSYVKKERMLEKEQEGKLLRNAQNSANFWDIDTNGDGEINKNEYQIHQEKQFKTKMMNNNKTRPGNGMGKGMGNNSKNGQ